MTITAPTNVVPGPHVSANKSQPHILTNPQEIYKAKADPIATIGDIIRGSLLTKTLEQIPPLLESVTKRVIKKGGQLYIKNFWNNPSQFGYVGVHLKIHMPLPKAGDWDKITKYMLMELQIHASEIMDGTKTCPKELAHRLYKMLGATTENNIPLEVIDASKLLYLIPMTKLLYEANVSRVDETLRLLQEMTPEAEVTIHSGMKAALFLERYKLGPGTWNKGYQVVVPKNRDAFATTWDDTATKINKMLNLPTSNMEKNCLWINTAKSVDELYENAMQMAPLFKKICKKAAKSQPDCFVSFGPENKHMIKEKPSLLDKIEKDKKAQADCKEEVESGIMNALTASSLDLSHQNPNPVNPSKPVVLHPPASSSQPPSAPPEAFGEEKWTTLCGRVAPAPPLPPGFSAIWNGPCPIFPDKKVSDTHMLVYIPATVDGKPLTLKNLGEIAKRYFPNNAEGYERIWESCVKELGDRPIAKACWVLMTKDILPGSRSKSYTVQATMVSALAKKALAPYEVPKTLEAAVCILTHYFSSKTFLFPRDPLTCTRCQENIEGYQVAVGGFAPTGLRVGSHDCDDDIIAVAALRKLVVLHPPASSSQPPSAPPEAFGEEKWTALCGRVAPAPPLPPGFSAIWNGPCPIFPDKKVSDTHMIVYIPATVDGKPLTLKSLGEIAKRYFPNNAKGYYFIFPDIVKELGDRLIDKARWVLMTKDVLPGSRSKSYDDQKNMVSALAKKTLAPYEVPQTLEAAVCILTHYFSSKTRLFARDPETYTRCQEDIRRCQVVVGSFAPAGLVVDYDNFYDVNFAVAALRKF